MLNKVSGIDMLPLKEKIISMAKDTIETLGYISVDINLAVSKSGRTLKAVIYKKNSDISMDDCAKVSNVLLRRLELEIPDFSENYDLLVESPGVDRKLESLEELKIFSDKEIRFVIKKPDKYGIKDSVLIGNILRFEDNKVIIKHNDTEYKLDNNDFSARLYFDIKKYL